MKGAKQANTFKTCQFTNTEVNSMNKYLSSEDTLCLHLALELVKNGHVTCNRQSECFISA